MPIKCVIANHHFTSFLHVSYNFFIKSISRYYPCFYILPQPIAIILAQCSELLDFVLKGKNNCTNLNIKNKNRLTKLKFWYTLAFIKVLLQKAKGDANDYTISFGTYSINKHVLLFLWLRYN